MTNTIPTIILAICTAYCPCKKCCGPNAKGITAIGRKPTAGRTIAGPRWIPLGTKVALDGLTYVVEDRTAKRYDGRFDVFFSSHEEARRFGKRTNNIVILGK